jgi:hypothetical protein
MPDQVKVSVGRERKPRSRTWNEYPDPTRDTFFALFGIAIIAMVFGFCCRGDGTF